MSLSIKNIGLVVAVFAAAIAVLGGRPAEAGLLGKQLDAVYYAPDLGTPYANAGFTPPSFVVGPGQETDGVVEGVTHLLVDFDDTTLTVTLTTTLTAPTWNSAPFNGIVFTSPGLLGIAGATVDPATTMAGFDDSRVSFNADQILVNWNGLSYVDGTVVKIDFEFAAVPEPASLALLGAALAGMGLARRRFSARSKRASV
jgi:hypothetical protein